MDIDWDQLEKRLPMDLAIVATGVVVHNVLSCAVFKERRRIENQQQNVLNLDGMYLIFHNSNIAVQRK